MRLFRPSDLQNRLTQLQTHAKKKLSQNFLVDGNILQKIVNAASIEEEDLVLEIGPGPGALTQALLERGATVIAIEKDPIFAKALEDLGDQKSLHIICDDFLSFPLEDFLSSFPKGKEKIKVVANLPYQISTPILTKLLPLHEKIETITVMLQKEFAHRCVGKVGTNDYSSFSLFVQFFSDPSYRFTVEPTCFIPKPNVRSSVVQFRLRKPALETGQESFFQLTRSTFAQRRKMLRSTLKKEYSLDVIEKTLQNLGCLLTTRPEELSLSQFLQLHEDLVQSKGF